MNLYISVFLCCIICLFGTFAPTAELRAAEPVNQLLTFSRAVELSETLNPQLLSLSAKFESIKSLRTLDYRVDNPHLIIGFDEFGGNGNFSGTSSLKSSIGISQKLRTSGKTRIRKNIARAEILAASHKLSEIHRNIKIETAKRFFALSKNEKRLLIAKEDLEIARENAAITRKRVETGDLPGIDETRSLVNLSEAELGVKKEKRNLYETQLKIAELWNEQQFDFTTIEYDPTPFNNLRKAIHAYNVENISHPAIEAADAKIAAASAVLNLAKAQQTPDITVSGKLNRFRETGKHAFSIECEIELPSRGREKLMISAGKADFTAANIEKEAIKKEIANEFILLRNTIESLHEEFIHASEKMLPAGIRGLKEAQKAFSIGERNLTELFEARKNLLEIRRIASSIETELYQKIYEFAVLVGEDSSIVYSH